jgi:DNA-binding YbaB/EbfC family protein
MSMFKGMGGMGNLLKEAQKQAAKLQQQMGEVQRSLKNRVVEGTAGGGMVTAHVNGHMELLAVKIDPEVVDKEEVEMLQDLIVAAVTQGMKKAQEMSQEEMKKVTGGLNIPGLGLPGML